ncbi:MAG: Phosphopantetheine adenylyltransferase [Planctomycetota bacterium]|jgi:pantetheine-phosphate adenylyltransferase
MAFSETAASHACYLGSFDPMTLGHQDIIQRACRIFSRVTVGIGINPDKNSLFTPTERVELCRAALEGLPNVEVRTFDGLAVEFVRQCGSRILLRGVRTLSDLDAEFSMTLANRVLDESIESVFLMSADRFAHISSSLIKQIAEMAHENPRRRLQHFLPEPIIQPLMDRLHQRRRSVPET